MIFCVPWKSLEGNASHILKGVPFVAFKQILFKKSIVKVARQIGNVMGGGEKLHKHTGGRIGQAMNSTVYDD